MKEILFHDLTIKMERRQVKNLNLYVKPPEGEILVTIPVRMPEKRVMEFLEMKLEWIRNAREKVISRQMEEITAAEKTELLRKILMYAQKWEPVLGVQAAKWQLRKMKTRWGSCSVESGNIRINIYLAKKPEECLEYVVLHELCHLLEANHGPGFHQLLDKYMPDWRERKQILEHRE